MNLPSIQQAVESLRIRKEQMAGGECTYCGSNQHFRNDCKRLAKEARDLRAAEINIASVTPVVPATTQPAVN
jgi:hypothetical protein